MLRFTELRSYFQRIGLSPPAVAELSALQAIVAAHERVIPFENLDPFLGRAVDLELAAVHAKLVHEQRGGYCFEHNLLLGEVLRSLEYKVTSLAARVLWARPEDAITPRSHMLFQVTVAKQRYLVDVGFGGNTLSGVLPWVFDIAHETSHESFRLLLREGDHFLQCQLPDGWKTLYRFDLQAQYPIDYQASSYFLSTHPQSHFVTGLSAARVTAEGRLVLRDRDFSIHVSGGTTTRRSLCDAAEIRSVLEREFLIRLPSYPGLDQRLESLPSA